MLSIDLSRHYGILGPRASLSRGGYTTDIIENDSEFDVVPDGVSLEPDDYVIIFNVLRTGIRPMPAFICLLYLENYQFIGEAILSFIDKGMYSELMEFLKIKGEYERYEKIAMFLFGSVEEEDLIDFFRE